MSRWFGKWRTLSGREQKIYEGHVTGLKWRLTDEQREYIIDSVKAGRKPNIAMLSRLASIPDDA